ncbi:multiple resistance and pH regulation protein F [Erythrobacteraceae bacterium CFH 75059]|uniref:monovalent cation/H+ antiporter complex subunit F n=1 Tax=Qipengyuania thermophila TaxID=2509361 RepID=UPI00101F4A6C|nr:monovalent cation/H+ antiporter complex subunit F [Qipengyuania thermophila]TCD06780.1 multiple resistance and pH regulation protein F [Erythrobacteraceae bacterium CFH 75059]
MTDLLYVAALVILANVAVSAWRVLHGPARADRIMGAQLIGTSGVALLVLLYLIHGSSGVLDLALLLALLAAFAAVGYVKSRSADGAGDPEVAGGEDP